MSIPGTSDNPLRIAIIGSGPSGFYAAERLQKEADLVVTVDMYDRLPTPYGLVRGGVAPDHPKIKNVTKKYDQTAEKPGFRFFGNVEFGKDVTRDDLAHHYHALIYTVGAQTDRNLGIPGEDLPGSHAATEFVAWYNAHPDFKDYEFDLTQENVAVIGVGNVAMDVARILARTEAELHATDIADYALDALVKSSVKNIYIIGRRGPAQVKFTFPEIKEFGEMEGADCIVAPAEVELDPASQAFLDSPDGKKMKKIVDKLKEQSDATPSGKGKQIIFRFLASPVEFSGNGRVQQMKIVKNELYQTDRGDLRPRATEQFETIDVGLVFRSVGYRGVPLPGVPFRDDWGTIPHTLGRVMSEPDGDQQVTGDYVAGWIKRGPSGVIGTNKKDSVETVGSLLEDLQADKLLSPGKTDPDAVINLLKSRNIRYVTFADWKRLDAMEVANGEAVGRPRVKFSDVDEMLAALDA